MSMNFNLALADKFNRKKTRENDLMRLRNVQPKINQHIPILKLKSNFNPSHIKEAQLPTETFYQFDKILSSTTLDFDISRENINDKIPKITLKEMVIPSYSVTDNFDLNSINKNLSTKIHMDMFLSDVINDGDVNRLKKRKIKKIFHIYQEYYSGNTFPTGFGDFIRSCFFIVQFCVKYGFEYEILINHPIALFLDKFYSNYQTENHLLNNKITMFTETNWVESVFNSENNIEQFLLSKQKFNLFIDYLCSLPVINNSVVSYNIFFPYDSISLEESDKIRLLFEPSREMSEYVDDTLLSLDLVKKDFIVIQIRSGDSYLKGENKIFNSVYFEVIKNEIIEVIFNNKEKNVLLIADNNEIKCLLNEHFNHFKTLLLDITHLGEGVKLDKDEIKNTLLDFYLMAQASYIYSFTSYPHGSGFSYWCSKLYNIPYKCKYINVK